MHCVIFIILKFDPNGIFLETMAMFFHKNKNPHTHIAKHIVHNVHAKFRFNLFSSFRGEDFQSWKSKIWEKNPFQYQNSFTFVNRLF